MGERGGRGGQRGRPRPRHRRRGSAAARDPSRGGRARHRRRRDTEEKGSMMAEQLVCVKTDTRKVEMQKLPVPTPGPGQALIKTRLSTICGSDIHIVDEL